MTCSYGGAAVFGPGHTVGDLRLEDWRSLSLGQQDAVRALSITADQVDFAGAIDAAIELCEIDNGSEIVGVAILARSTVVGFLLVKRGASAPAWVADDAAIATALRVDEEFQGRGIGTNTLVELPSWVKRNWPDRKSLVLSVDESNRAAIRSYTKAGWIDQGRHPKGWFSWERRMMKPVK